MTLLDKLASAWAAFQRFVNVTMPAQTTSLHAATAKISATAQPPTGGGVIKLQ